MREGNSESQDGGDVKLQTPDQRLDLFVRKRPLPRRGHPQSGLAAHRVAVFLGHILPSPCPVGLAAVPTDTIPIADRREAAQFNNVYPSWLRHDG